MRLVIDYFFATQFVGIFTMLGLILAILLLVTKFGPARPDRRRRPFAHAAWWGFAGAITLFCLFLFVQVTFMPLPWGRPGYLRQAVILDSAVVFTDLYPRGGAEYGDTPGAGRLWFVNRATGCLRTRIRLAEDSRILAANATNLLVVEDGDCFSLDGRGKPATRYITDSLYAGKKIHRMAFRDGSLILSMKDLTEVRLSVPFTVPPAPAADGITFRWTDADRETWELLRRENGRTIWRHDQRLGTIRQHLPELLYAAQPAELYLLWTETRLLAVDRKDGRIRWTFRY